jgi:prepilin-type N-terminal cleavage/methylation domain-containing protein/prepilin-type processing-associated H-X9-DG protein
MIRLSSVRKPRFGFTLVELLVVIVIVATLAALGFLGARTAITSSQQSACAANLRNLGAALHLYSQDHGGRFPETTHSTSLDGAWVYALEAYLGNFEQSRVCPADPKRAARIEARGSSYLLNSFIFVPETDPFGEPLGPALNRPDAIPEPTRTIIAFICSDGTGSGPGNDHTHSNQWSSWTALASDIAPGRFGGGAPLEAKGRSNYLYVDGRVESMSAAEVKRKLESGINIAKPPGIP